LRPDNGVALDVYRSPISTSFGNGRARAHRGAHEGTTYRAHSNRPNSYCQSQHEAWKWQMMVANIREVGLRSPSRCATQEADAEGKQFDLVCGKEGSRPSLLLANGHTSDHYRGNARRSFLMSLVENIASGRLPIGYHSRSPKPSGAQQ